MDPNLITVVVSTVAAGVFGFIVRHLTMTTVVAKAKALTTDAAAAVSSGGVITLGGLMSAASKSPVIQALEDEFNRVVNAATEQAKQDAINRLLKR